MSNNQFAVFVKPWKNKSLAELGPFIKNLGFDWIELPVRPGFPCEPDQIETTLPQAAAQLADAGVQILNITAALPMDDERLYAACAKANVAMNRVMFRTGDMPYPEAEDGARRQLDAALPLCEQYGVQIGVQNHIGNFVPVHAMGLKQLLKDYDSKYVGAIWDAGHNGLAGMEADLALDVIGPHLCVVNLKNAFWRRVSGPEAEVAEWKVHWTSGRQGRASWPKVAAKLKAIGYSGPICLTAEYSDEASVERLIVEDLAFARGCFGVAESK